MQVYNVEIYDSTLSCIYHTNIETVSYAFDYLSMKENTINIELTNVITKGNYIRLENGINSYFGIVTAIDKTENELIVGYKPFTYHFCTNCIFDTDLQGSNTSLETTIKNQIISNFVNNSDTLQNISILGEITTTSSTTSWGFNLKSDKENMHITIVSLYDVILTRAFSKYGVVVNVIPNFSTRKVNLEIGKVDSASKTIEAALPNVLSKSIVIRESNNDINKAVMVNTSNYSNRITYYLHPNGTFNTTNNNRITPVISKYIGVDVKEGKTFTQAAAAQAVSTFGSIQYSNLIELEVLNDDTLVNPKGLEIGQTVNVIYKGVSYSSILSAYKVGLTTLLTFGSIRLDLSKLLKTGGI